jgi:hypothetical protein
VVLMWRVRVRGVHPQGQVSIGELSETLQLSTSLVSAAVAKRLGTILHAELRGSTLYTAAFLQREAGRIRGAFSAITKCVCSCEGGGGPCPRCRPLRCRRPGVLGGGVEGAVWWGRGCCVLL